MKKKFICSFFILIYSCSSYAMDLKGEFKALSDTSIVSDISTKNPDLIKKIENLFDQINFDYTNENALESQEIINVCINELCNLLSELPLDTKIMGSYNMYNELCFENVNIEPNHLIKVSIESLINHLQYIGECCFEMGLTIEESEQAWYEKIPLDNIRDFREFVSMQQELKR